jgi:serine/threonine protein kinase
MSGNASFTGGSQKRSRLALPEGFRLGRYLIAEQLGAGGFGITYRAKDSQLNRWVAIKELLPTSIATRTNTFEVVAHTDSEEDDWSWAQERFIQEAETVAACEHQNVLQVYEVFKANGTVYMATRFEEGCNLNDWYKQLNRPPNELELRAVLAPMLSALDRVHSQGFLHRDIKPENIYMSEGKRPILIDFGSARQKITHKSLPLTKIVTPNYAPFEQYLDDGHQGPFTDLYSLGAVMYRGITGQKPPEAPQRSLPAGKDPCIRLTKTFKGTYDRVFLECIDAALAPEPKDRPQRACDWLNEIGGDFQMPSGHSRAIGREARPLSDRLPPPPPRQPETIKRPSRGGDETAPSKLLTLRRTDATGGAPPVQLVGTERFRIGRERKSVEFASWFWPRTTHDDGRTMRMGRIHLQIVHDHGQLLVENRNSANGVAFDGCSLPDNVSMILRGQGTLLLSEDYQLQVTPFPSQQQGRENKAYGAVRFDPLNTAFAHTRPVWILSDATFGSADSNAIYLPDPGVAEVHGGIYFHDGEFWIESFSAKNPVLLEGRAIPLEKTVPLAGVQRLRLGSTDYQLVEGRL